MATEEKRLRWKLIPYGAQWAVTEEGTGFVILTRNTLREALEEGRIHAKREKVELIEPAEEDDNIPGERAGQ